MKAGKIMSCLLGVMLICTGIWMKRKKAMSIAIIGGADGPTSVFIAGKVPDSAGVGLEAVGILLLLLFLIWVIKKK